MSLATELDALLAQEIDRRLATSAEVLPSEEHLRTILHVLKGSAAMAGHPDLALLVTQLGQRLRALEPGVSVVAVASLREVSRRLKLGKRPFDSQWPEPPEGLKPSRVPAEQRGEYLNLMQERLRELNEIVSSGFGDPEQLGHAVRIIHSMKALSGSVGDDTTAWYCHHLEAKLRHPVAEAGSALRAFSELAAERATLLRLLENPDEAFAVLRAHRMARSERRTTPPPFRLGDSIQLREHRAGHGLRSSTLPPAVDGELDPDTTVRVPTTALDQMLDHLERIAMATDGLLETAGETRAIARDLAKIRQELTETRRLLGKSGGMGSVEHVVQRLTAGLEHLGKESEKLESVEQGCKRCAELLRAEWNETRHGLGRLRRTTMSHILARCKRAVHRFAAAEGKTVAVETVGGEWSVDRTLGERLLEALLQIAKNSVCHGIELPEQRLLDRKLPAGNVRFTAERHGDWIRVIVEDDGAGVDLEGVRNRAIEQGLIEECEAKALGKEELLSLLFLPGLSTRTEANVMAGRGVGLELAEEVIRRLGGGIRMMTRVPSGVQVTLELPQELGMMDVVWVTAGRHSFALPISFTGALLSHDASATALPLLSCLGLACESRPLLAIELLIPGMSPLAVGIDELGDFEEVNVRALPRLLAKAGPYSGAVLGGDGRLCFVLDPPLVVTRAWMHTPS